MKFTAKKVKELFMRELTSYTRLDQSFSGYVVESPRSCRFKTMVLINGDAKKRHRWMWVVLDMNPSKPDGRCITFDPRTATFALAEKSVGWKFGNLILESPDLNAVLDPMEV